MRPRFFLGASLSSGQFLALIFIFTLIFPPRAALAADASCAFLETRSGPLNFKDVEMVARTHAIGLHRAEDIVLERWIPISSRADLGIDRQGRILQVIRLEDRTVALLLSGGRTMKDLFLRAPSTLLAVDESGAIHSFSWSGWAATQTRGLVRHAAMISAASSCAVAFPLGIYAWSMGIPLDSAEVLYPLGFSALSAVMIQGFLASVHFERQNQNTSGLAPAGAEVLGFRLSEPVRDAHGSITDYILRGHSEHSLMNLVGSALAESDSADHFDWRCEFELLPRGVPVKNYE